MVLAEALNPVTCAVADPPMEMYDEFAMSPEFTMSVTAPGCRVIIVVPAVVVGNLSVHRFVPEAFVVGTNN
jgi:hypothetical protein